METVLDIEDDQSLRDMLGLMLENEGFRPVLATTVGPVFNKHRN